ncbi:MAG: TraM recognition domain-containing protein [Bacteroidota bacterium]
MKKNASEDSTNLRYPLINFSYDEKDKWYLEDAVRGVQIFGGIGSGKSSGSGKTIAYSFLESGYGGIVLTGKVDETYAWLKYAQEINRLNDIVIFSESPEKYYKDSRYSSGLKHLKNKVFYFNPLNYELAREGEGAGDTDNIVSLFMSIVKMGNRVGGSGTDMGNDPFWPMAMQRCIKSAIDLLKLAKAVYQKYDKKDVGDFELTIPNIARIIREAPSGKGNFERFEQLTSSNNATDLNSLQKWINESYVIYCLSWASGIDQSNIRDKSAYEVAKSYFLADFAVLAEKTRSAITEYFYAFASPFRSGLLAEFFSGVSSEEIKPEETFKGRIIILDFPVKKYLQVGIYAQAIYKKLWQQAVERRDIKPNDESLPVFMWIDEAQYFLNEDDMMFQTTARASKACTVLISQNISNYYAAIGGSNPQDQVNSLLGNLSTKIFHANNDYVTNEWAANTIGRTFQNMTSVGSGENANVNISKALNYQVEPETFTRLRNGGEANDFQVDAIITVASKEWSNELNYYRTFFYQKRESVFQNKK